MKTKKGYRLRQLGKEYILVAEGLEVMGANQMISMNETAAFLWKAVEGKTFDTEALAKLRVVVDTLECLTDDAQWPLPKYREMLFIY